jgi:hypothetical protein
VHFRMRHSWQARPHLAHAGRPPHAPTKRLSPHANAHEPCRIAVGTPIAGRPPHRSERARFGHSAPTLGEWRAKTLAHV